MNKRILAFLDLQKAEAQAREAQINLAVESVRASALAMNKSEEMMEVVALDIPDVIAATIFLNEGHDKVKMWDLSSVEKSIMAINYPLTLPLISKKEIPFYM